MGKESKTSTSKLAYHSQTQLTLAGFETPFTQKLDPTNRWVRMSKLIDWNAIVGHYNKNLNNQKTGASSINPRVVIGSMIIKHYCKLSEKEMYFRYKKTCICSFF